MYKLIRLTTTIRSLKNSLSRPALRRHVLFAIVPAAAFVAVAVALSLPARAGRIEGGAPQTSPTPTPTATPAPKFRVIATVDLPLHSQAAVTVNQALNKIYTSGGFTNGDTVFVIDGMTFTGGPPVGSPIGSGASVDTKTDRYWAATVFGGGSYPSGVVVRDGANNTVVTTISLGGCAGDTAYDLKNNRMWVGYQCGNDGVFAIDASSYSFVQIPVGCVMGGIIANGVNGRLYINETFVNCQASKRVSPTFAVTTNAFGYVLAINTLTNKLYAIRNANILQIIDGAPDPEQVLIEKQLPNYTFGNSIAVNPAFNYLYIANSATNSIEVRDAATGVLITRFSNLQYPPDGPMTVDSIRGRIYYISASNGPALPKLVVIEDLINASKPQAIIGHF